MISTIKYLYDEILIFVEIIMYFNQVCKKKIPVKL